MNAYHISHRCHLYYRTLYLWLVVPCFSDPIGSPRHRFRYSPRQWLDLNSSSVADATRTPFFPVPASRIFYASSFADAKVSSISIALAYVSILYSCRCLRSSKLIGFIVFAVDRSVLSFVLLPIELVGLDWFYRSCCRRIFGRLN